MNRLSRRLTLYSDLLRLVESLGPSLSPDPMLVGLFWLSHSGSNAEVDARLICLPLPEPIPLDDLCSQLALDLS